MAREGQGTVMHPDVLIVRRLGSSALSIAALVVAVATLSPVVTAASSESASPSLVTSPEPSARAAPSASDMPTEPPEPDALEVSLATILWLEADGVWSDHPLAGAPFEVVVTHGTPEQAVVVAGADGTVSFEVTVDAGQPAAHVRITDLQRDYRVLGASCGHDFEILVEWSAGGTLEFDLEPGWTDIGCVFEYKVFEDVPAPTPAPARPMSDPTLPPTDTAVAD